VEKIIVKENFDLLLLHDASLLSVFLEWKIGKLTIGLRFYDPVASSIKSLKIIATCWVTFNCPRKEEWGPSASINKVDIKELSKEVKILSIEMQSGDTIFIEAKDFSIERA
jgi:hypothetical protein